ncbi:rhomboid family intramembrane serine protease [Actinocrispum sp. NPDC049592]|uniref:rhomboid family intramembrane serine protease n=1 Tax=Actinocrispum sp. NPDC049592 TaxID=3154835 RepID=UPI003441C080
MAENAVPALPGVRTKLPVGTIVVLGVWAVCTAVYHLGGNGLFLAVRRDPEALRAGEVWRVISPVLVQPDSVLTVLGLGVFAAVLGTVTERAFGTGRWVVLFLAGALAGHLIGEIWQPYSGGVSVGFCGPLGALAVCLILTRKWQPGVVVLAGAVALTVITDIHGPAILAGALAGLPLIRSGARALPATQPTRE